MTSFCHGKFFVKNSATKKNVVKDAQERIQAAEKSKAKRLNKNSDSDGPSVNNS